jgi:hypothetical protein
LYCLHYNKQNKQNADLGKPKTRIRVGNNLKSIKMKKTSILIILQLIITQSFAQIVSLDLCEQISHDPLKRLSGQNFNPQQKRNMGLKYVHKVKKMPIALNLGVGRSTKVNSMGSIEQIGGLTYMGEPVDSIINKNGMKASSVQITGGLGWMTMPLKSERVILSLNTDLGLDINNKVTGVLVRQGVQVAEVKRKPMEFILNPHLNLTYLIPSGLGVNLTGGYTNQGGPQFGIGARWRVKCMICYRRHRVGRCPDGYTENSSQTKS